MCTVKPVIVATVTINFMTLHANKQYNCFFYHHHTRPVNFNPSPVPALFEYIYIGNALTLTRIIHTLTLVNKRVALGSMVRPLAGHCYCYCCSLLQTERISNSSSFLAFACSITNHHHAVRSCTPSQLFGRLRDIGSNVALELIVLISIPPHIQ